MEISASSLMQEMQALKIEAGATPLAQPGRQVTSDFGLLLQQALGNVNELQGAANDLRTRFDMGDKSVDLAEVMIVAKNPPSPLKPRYRCATRWLMPTRPS